MKLPLRDAVTRHPLRAFLLANGAGFCGIGLSWWLAPSRGRLAGIEWFPGLSLEVVAVIWCVGGGLAILAGATGRHFRAGFAGLQAASLFMGLVFTVSAIIGFTSNDILPDGERRSIITAISYFVFWASAVIVAQIRPPEVVPNDD